MSNFFGNAYSGKETVAVYDGPVYEGYNVNHGGAHAIAMESANDQLGIIAAIADLDVQVSEFTKESNMAGEEGFESVLENYTPVLEASGAGVLEKIKTAMKTLWGKVRAFFDSVLRTLDGVTKSTEDFVKKYKSQIEKLQLSGFKYTMYSYTVDALDLKYDDKIINTQQGVVDKITATIGAAKMDSANDDVLKTVDEAIDKMAEAREEELDKFRGSIIGKGPLSSEDFNKEVHEALRGNKDSAEEVNVNVHKIMEEVKGTAKLKEAIKKAKTEADKLFGKAIAMVDKLTDAVNKSSVSKSGKAEVNYQGPAGEEKMRGGNMSTQIASKAARVSKLISSTLSAQQAVVNAAISQWNSAVKERDAVYKKVLVKAFSHKVTND